MIEFLGSWIAWGIIQFFFMLLVSLAGDYGPESNLGFALLVLVGGPVIWVIFGIAYIALILEERESSGDDKSFNAEVSRDEH